MKKINRVRGALATLAVLAALGFGGAQAVASSAGSKCVNPISGCPCKAGCRYGGTAFACCVPL
jgi:hypothetical protein